MEASQRDYTRALLADASYIEAASQLEEKQQKCPQFLPFWSVLEDSRRLHETIRENKKGQFAVFAYRGKVVRLDSTDTGVLRATSEGGLWGILNVGLALIKQHVIRKEKHYDKVLREIDAFENMEKLEDVPREPISENVRLFVWQRDKGQCVKCGARERLEFDHIIPVTSGGSSTERNVQLLCESCNRSKGASV